MLTDYLKMSIAYNVFSPNTQDLGLKSCALAIKSVKAGLPYDSNDDDFLTAYMVHSINNAQELDDIESDFDYAIAMLTKAKNAALHGPLKDAFDYEREHSKI